MLAQTRAHAQGHTPIATWGHTRIHAYIRTGRRAYTATRPGTSNTPLDAFKLESDPQLTGQLQQQQQLPRRGLLDEELQELLEEEEELQEDGRGLLGNGAIRSLVQRGSRVRWASGREGGREWEGSGSDSAMSAGLGWVGWAGFRNTKTAVPLAF